MLRFYKKHIALFFALLFVVSQLHHVVHSLFEHHHECCEHVHNETQEEVDSEIYKTFKEKASFSEAHDCTLCQQFQNTKLQFAQIFNLDVKNQFCNTYKPILFKRSLSSSFLLGNILLRGPPSIF